MFAALGHIVSASGRWSDVWHVGTINGYGPKIEQYMQQLWFWQTSAGSFAANWIRGVAHTFQIWSADTNWSTQNIQLSATEPLKAVRCAQIWHHCPDIALCNIVGGHTVLSNQDTFGPHHGRFQRNLACRYSHMTNWQNCNTIEISCQNGSLVTWNHVMLPYRSRYLSNKM